jgi:hypothetical protein
MHFNEAFENSQLDYMNLQKKVDNLVKGEIYGDIKTHTEKVRDSLLQMDCFRRIHEYLSKSEKIARIFILHKTHTPPQLTTLYFRF